MKKLYLILVILILQTSACYAITNLRLKAQEDFTTANAPETIKFIVVKDSQIGEYKLKGDDIIECSLKIKPPRRGKRNAVFYIQPTSILSGDEITEITKKMRGRYTNLRLSKSDLKQVDAGKVAAKTAIKAGEYFAKNMTPAIVIAEGMIKNEEGNRIKSGVTQLYKDSPLSYISKGKDITLKEGEEFYVVFKTKKIKNKNCNIENSKPENETITDKNNN